MSLGRITTGTEEGWIDHNVPHMSQQLQAERMRVERQTLLEKVVSMCMSSFGTSLSSCPVLSWPILSNPLLRPVINGGGGSGQARPEPGPERLKTERRKGEHIRLSLALGTSEPSDGAEDDDEDDADEEAPAIVARVREWSAFGVLIRIEVAEASGHTRLPFCVIS